MKNEIEVILQKHPSFQKHQHFKNQNTPKNKKILQNVQFSTRSDNTKRISTIS